MSDGEAVLLANEAFYRAFATRDLEAMDAVWARDAPVACLHPGWAVLAGRNAVMESWAGILRNEASPQIKCHEPQAFMLGDTAFVVCYELVRGGQLVATNVFTREDEGWKMVHHQAGPTAAIGTPIDTPPDIVH